MSDEQPVPETFQTLATRIEALGTSVDEAFLEQRTYTEFAFEKLRSEMLSGFARLERKLDRVIDALSKKAARRRRRP